MVQSGGCSANDFREVFKKNIERRVRSLPEIDGLSKETVLSSWIAKYDAIYRGDEELRRGPQRAHLSAVSELILSKEQLYEMFQQILGIRKFEHQLLYNACQERRYPKLVSADMEALYVEELRSSVNLLMANLESLPVSKGGPDFKQKLKRSSLNNSFLDMGDEGDILSKSDVVLSFNIEVILNPTTNGPKQAEFHRMVVPKNSQDTELKIKLAVRMDKPPNMKHSGYLYALGQRVWKRWKRRYFVLVQVSQYTFAMCSYREKKAEPQELMQLEGYTVDYCDPQPGLQGGRVFFNAVREGELVMFACDDEQDRVLWVQAMYRATGQSYKPYLLSRTRPSTAEGPTRKIHRPSGWFSPGQVFVLDEYCARYGVRGCHRHLSYLKDLMDYSENSSLVDPTLLHYSYAFCASHVHGNRPDGMGTVTVEEKEQFEAVRSRLMVLLEDQITHFRYCFPFGRPDGALKATLSLQERVLMKDITTPVPAEEMKKLVQKCLEKAAQINYNQLLEYAQIKVDPQAAPEKRLEDMMRLGELCIEVLQQNEEHHSEAFSWWPELMAEHSESFMFLYRADMDAALQVSPLTPHLCNGAFHKHLQDLFMPLVVRYIDLMESSIAQSIHRGFEQETWQSVNLQGINLPDIFNGTATSEDLFWKLDALQMFVMDLHWPEPEFAKHLEQRLKLMASDMMEACVKRTKSAFDSKMQKSSKSTDFRVPLSVCTMFNVLMDAKKQCSKLCVLDTGQETDKQWQQYHSKIDVLIDETFKEMIASLVSKFASVLDGVLSKLSRYDEGTFFSSFLSFTQWYTSSMKSICVWLTDRLDLQLHMYQLKSLIKIVKKSYRDFRLQGVLDGTLNNKSYETIYNRLTVEEATAAVKAGDGLQGISMRDSDEEDE
ncbi:hypothetical protein WMY93_012289 [Mugilogobius chulae]|uniref:Calcium-dependent secretion activator 2 n=1 Tax=Mugilogobius chulae TaxID=88201 RepID=A0AAW0P522_9GOBI